MAINDERPPKRMKNYGEPLDLASSAHPAGNTDALVNLYAGCGELSHPIHPATNAAPIGRRAYDRGKGLLEIFACSGLGKSGPIETDVGITQYIDPSIPPFTGVIKHRFTDFMVYEVGLDGQVIRLKDLKAPTKESSSDPSQPPAVKILGANEPSSLSRQQLQFNAAGNDQALDEAKVLKEEPEVWNDVIQAYMAILIKPEEKLDEFRNLVVSGFSTSQVPQSNISSEQGPFFRTSAMDERDQRTELHKCLREFFPEKMISETKELDSGEQIVEIFWKRNAGRGQKRDRQSRAEQAAARGKFPPYIHFTLQKTNREMHDALGSLCRTLQLHNRDIGSAGTKDKRAITVQRVSVKRGGRTTEDVWRAARGGGGRGGGGRGRDSNGGSRRDGRSHATQTGEKGVRIGDLEYNEVMLDLGMSRGNKFVISLRDVKVDSLETIERAMSTLKNGGFINYYGMQRFGTSPIPTHVIGLTLFRQDWALAVDLLLRERSGESDDIAFARKVYAEGKVAEALRLMPRRAVAERAILESFNKMGNTTDCLRALTQIPKNLRMMYVHAWQSYVWNRVVSERIALYGCKKPTVGDLVYDGAGDPDEIIHTESSTSLVTPEALDPDLVNDGPSLSAPLSETDKLRQTSKVAKVKALTQEDIDLNRFTIFDVVLPLPGFNVVYPSNTLADIYKAIMKSDGIDPDNLFRKQKEYSLGGAYRKIVHLPTDVSHRLLLYYSPAEDLAQSDEDALLGRAPPTAMVFNPSIDQFPPKDGQHLALQIELTLASSTYATMALRELLKVSTQSQHQRSLTKEMEDEFKQKEEQDFQESSAEGKEMLMT